MATAAGALGGWCGWHCRRRWLSPVAAAPVRPSWRACVLGIRATIDAVSAAVRIFLRVASIQTRVRTGRSRPSGGWAHGVPACAMMWAGERATPLRSPRRAAPPASASPQRQAAPRAQAGPASNGVEANGTEPSASPSRAAAARSARATESDRAANTRPRAARRKPGPKAAKPREREAAPHAGRRTRPTRPRPTHPPPAAPRRRRRPRPSSNPRRRDARSPRARPRGTARHAWPSRRSRPASRRPRTAGGRRIRTAGTSSGPPPRRRPNWPRSACRWAPARCARMVDRLPRP